MIEKELDTHINHRQKLKEILKPKLFDATTNTSINQPISKCQDIGTDPRPVD